VPLDPELAALLTQVNQAPPLSTHPPDQARELFRALCNYGAQQAAPVQVAATEDVEVTGADGPLPARIFRPQGEGPRATIAFFHGGGFTIGDTDCYDLQCRTLCAETGAVVVSTDYRLAPEHPFPAAVEDALAATRWIVENVAGLGGDERRVAVAGDSAGGNLAAVVAQHRRDEHPALIAQLLIYPATDFLSERPSHEENASGYFLTREDILWFHDNYLRDDSIAADVRLSPLRADDLSRLPPTVIATAGYDPLRDDGDAYAEALASAGVRVIHRRYPTLVHGFFGFGPFSRTAQDAIVELCRDLRALLDHAASM
jgi:acetyl esterase